jgi:hypothetical protein
VASIDGFLDHFEIRLAPRPVLRASLRSLQLTSRKSFEPSNVLLWLLVALLHVGLFLVLDFAMRPTAIARDTADTPLQVTIIQLTEMTKPHVITPADARRPPHPQHAIPQSTNALQAVAIQPPAVTQTPSTPMSTELRPALDLYDMQGDIRLPAPPIPRPSDPFARRPASEMLPGSDRAFAPGIRLAEVKSPKRVVETIGAMLFGGGHFDPCPEYEQRLLSADSEVERDEQLVRYERACPGR